MCKLKQLETHHDSVLLLASEFCLVDVLITVWLGVLRDAGAFMLAKLVEWVGPGVDLKEDNDLLLTLHPHRSFNAHLTIILSIEYDFSVLLGTGQ